MKNFSFMIATCLCLLCVPEVSRGESKSWTPPGPDISFDERNDGARGTVLKAYLKADIDLVWAVISSTKASKLFDTVESITPDSKQKGMWRYKLKYPMGSREIVCKVRRNKKSYAVSWKRVSGDFLAFEGSFKLAPVQRHPGYIKIHYRSYLNPGRVARLLVTERRRTQFAEDLWSRLQGLANAN